MPTGSRVVLKYLSWVMGDGQEFFDAERDFDPVFDDPGTHEPLIIP
jgi:hypothetical protein